MKLKLKNLTLLLVAIMCVCCFTACSNKTDEEKARDEIQSGFEEGLEKDEEIMSEADAYVEDRGALTDKLNEKLPDIADAWEAYITAGTVDESIEAAKAFAGSITEIEYDFQEYYKTENSDNNIEFVKDVLESFNTYDE